MSQQREGKPAFRRGRETVCVRETAAVPLTGHSRNISALACLQLTLSVCGPNMEEREVRPSLPQVYVLYVYDAVSSILFIV